MDEYRAFMAQFDAHLANRLHERQGFDVANSTADFHHGDIGVVGTFDNAVLDLVGNVRNHLHGAAQILAATLLADDALINLAGGKVA